jgi:hypothetical protein
MGRREGKDEFVGAITLSFVGAMRSSVISAIVLALVGRESRECDLVNFEPPDRARTSHRPADPPATAQEEDPTAVVAAAQMARPARQPSNSPFAVVSAAWQIARSDCLRAHGHRKSIALRHGGVGLWPTVRTTNNPIDVKASRNHGCASSSAGHQHG